MSNLPKDKAEQVLGPPAAGSLCECGNRFCVGADSAAYGHYYRLYEREKAAMEAAERAAKELRDDLVLAREALAEARREAFENRPDRVLQRQVDRARAAESALAEERRKVLTELIADLSERTFPLAVVPGVERAVEIARALMGNAPLAAPSASGEAIRLLRSAVEIIRWYANNPRPDGSLAQAWIENHPTLPAQEQPAAGPPDSVSALTGKEGPEGAAAQAERLRDTPEQVAPELAERMGLRPDDVDGLEAIRDALVAVRDAARADAAPLEGLKDLERAAAPQEDEQEDATETYARSLAEEADRRGTSISIHRCPKGEWIVGFGENMREVLAQEPDFGNALFSATVLRAFTSGTVPAPSASAVPATRMGARIYPCAIQPCETMWWQPGYVCERHETVPAKDRMGAAAPRSPAEAERLLRAVLPMLNRAVRDNVPMLGGQAPSLEESLRAAKEGALWMAVLRFLGEWPHDGTRAAPAAPPRCPHGYRADADGAVAGRDWEKCPHCPAPPAVPALPSGARQQECSALDANDPDCVCQQGEQTASRAADAASPSVSAEEPGKRVIPGCRHKLPRMLTWANEGACPICLTAEVGMLNEQLANSRSAESARDARWREAHAKLTPSCKVQCWTRDECPSGADLRALLGSVATEATPKEKK